MKQSSTFRSDLLWALLALALLALFPAFSSSRVLLDYVIRLAAMGIFATSLNILVGYGGLVSFGHAMFFGEIHRFFEDLTVFIEFQKPLANGECRDQIRSVFFHQPNALLIQETSMFYGSGT